MDLNPLPLVRINGTPTPSYKSTSPNTQRPTRYPLLSGYRSFLGDFNDFSAHPSAFQLALPAFLDCFGPVRKLWKPFGFHSKPPHWHLLPTHFLLSGRLNLTHTLCIFLFVPPFSGGGPRKTTSSKWACFVVSGLLVSFSERHAWRAMRARLGAVRRRWPGTSRSSESPRAARC